VSDDIPDPRLADERLAGAARAAQTLSDALWEALQEELIDPRSPRVAELTERLSEVAATFALLVRLDAARVREAPVEPVQSEPPTPRSTTEDEPPAGQPRPPRPSQLRPPRAPAVTQEPLSSPATLVDELAPQEPHEIEIRDVRGADGPTAWIGSIGRRLERYQQDSLPFAVLLVEIAGIERLGHAESQDELARLTSQVQDVLARGLRPADSLTRESPGRYWLLAPQTDVTGAQLLAERIARAVRSSASHRGTPLEVAVGIAVCPDDGRHASELAAHADVGLYGARAAGRPTAS
jgi:GGDEF domain-containing protein